MLNEPALAEEGQMEKERWAWVGVREVGNGSGYVGESLEDCDVASPRRVHVGS